MSNINPTYRNRVRFWIDNKTVGRKIIDEPLGWDEDQKEYARHKRHGIFPQMSSDLKFVGENKNMLDIIWDVEGVKAEVILIKEEKHPHNNTWVRSYWGFLDMLTREVEEGVLSFKFNSGGIEKLRSSRESQKVEIETLETIDGETLPPLGTKLIELEGRRVFLRTTYNVIDTDNEAKTEVDSNAGNERNQTCSIPVKLNNNSHEGIAHSSLSQTTSSESHGETGMMFFINTDRDREFKLSISSTLDVFFQQYENVEWCRYQVCLTKYENGVNYDLKERIVLHELRSESSSQADPVYGVSQRVLPDEKDYPYPKFTINNVVSTYENETFELLKGESLAFEVFLKSDMYVDNNAGVRAYARDIEANITVEENSYFPKSETKCVLAHDLIDRILKITTGTNTKLYSEVLGRTDIGYNHNGNTAFKGYAHGMWVRGFDQYPEDDENRYKFFTTSLKDVLDDLEVTDNLGLGIERIGYTERYIIEPREFFYQNYVAFRLPYKANKVKRKVAEDHLYGSLQIGFNEGFENEEAQGLDDYHANSSWNTTLGVVSNIYQKISKFIASSYAVEFIRRKPINDFQDYDHKNDKKIFIFDLKKYTSTLFHEKKWQDQLSKEPTGVFSSDNATKLLYSPLNLMLKHAKFFTSGFTKYLYDYLRLGGAEGNQNLKTQPIGGVERSEGDSIQNIELSKPLFLPELIEFEHIVDFNTNQALQGYTEINGRKVPNLYLVWEFINEDGDIESGFIESVKLNGEGKWVILKANR